ncbi:MAG TPA: DUF2062 domain-containing protein [Paracoccaceae bacterium]|nr:DUF2062 domain-containing protein [Paracoccaceae bacterium]
MVFKRRDRLPLGSRIREFFYPKKGWRRGVEYIGHRIKRLPDPPHRIAVGLAAGIFVSFTPFFGLHFLIAAAVAWAIRGNIFASIVGTFFGNPLTFPIIASFSLKLGQVFLGVSQHNDYQGIQHAFRGVWDSSWQWFKSLFGQGPSTWDGIINFFNDIFLPYLVGGILPGLVVATASYLITRPIVAAYQLRRRQKMRALKLEKYRMRKSKADLKV